MKHIAYFLLCIAMIFILCKCQADHEQAIHPGDDIIPDEDNGGLILPEGFRAVVVASDLGKGRQIAVNSNGDIYMSLRWPKDEKKGIVCLRDTSNDGKADIVKYFSNYHGGGLHIYKNHLYISTDSSLIRFPLIKNQLLPLNKPEVIIAKLEHQGQHATKTFAFDNTGNIYVNVGAPANACMEQTRTIGSSGLDPCPLLEKFGGVWRFNAEKNNQVQMEDGYRYVTGIRHCVAIEWNLFANNLYAVQHGRDQLAQFFPDLYTEELNAELPSEEFFLMKEGSDFGWPYCYFDHIQNKKVLAPEYGGDKEKTSRCNSKEKPILAFPGHYAPNDLIFYEGGNFPEKYKHGAFIAFHGSWNRAPLEQKGYCVAFVPFSGQLPSGNWEIFADGFKGADTLKSPRDAKHRPTGLAVGPDGSLYISDSVSGKIWRVFFKRK